METIKSIEDTSWKDSKSQWADSFDGFKIVTDEQTIELGISNLQGCCENWGYFLCNDDTSEFVGAALLGVEITDTALNEAIFNRVLEDGVYEGGVMFVDIKTDRGVLQFVAYNSHNGYYGHEAVVRSKQLTTSESL